MDTNYNISFKAKLLTNIRVKNNKALEEIQEGFERGTICIEGYFYKTRTDKKGVMSSHISSERLGDDCEFYSGNELFTEDINRQLKKYTPKQLIRKYIREFKTIKMRDKHDATMSEFRARISKYARKFKAIDKTSRACQSNGHDVSAKRLSYIADCCAGKVSECLQLLEREQASFNAKMKKLIKLDPDLNEIV